MLRLVRDDLGGGGRLVSDKDPVIVVLLRQHQVEAARADCDEALLIPAVVVLCDRTLASDAVLTIFTGLCHFLISSHLINSLFPGGRPTQLLLCELAAAALFFIFRSAAGPINDQVIR